MIIEEYPGRIHIYVDDANGETSVDLVGAFDFARLVRLTSDGDLELAGDVKDGEATAEFFGAA